MTYTEFRAEMKPFPNFSIREIKKYFPGFDRRRLVEWQKKGYIRRLRNRYYCFSDQKVNQPFLFYTANKIYSPSYISLESALSTYGFIPEGVFQITSCSTRKTQTFDTPMSSFRYQHLKRALYFGYHLEEWKNHHYAIARPEKALVDYLYLHSEIKEVCDITALRWNAGLIDERISYDRLSKYQDFISSPALSNRINLLKDFLYAAP